jgi:hypothetical protein
MSMKFRIQNTNMQIQEVLSMIKKCVSIFSLIFLLLVGLSSPVEARSMIYDILAKGSQWSLNVDGETGTLELLGGRGSRTRDGGWVMTMDINWQGNPGTLRAQADGGNTEQHVALAVQRRNGLKVNCEGYIAMETDRFMAGITRHAARPGDLHGAWYATLLKSGPRMSDRTPTEEPEKPAEPVSSTAVVKPAGKIVRERGVQRIPVTVAAPTGSISGKVYGAGMYAAKVFHVSLYGPDDFKRFRETKKFDASGGYTFTGLAGGKYRIVVDTKADIAIGPHPPYRVVECKGDAVREVNFELK